MRITSLEVPEPEAELAADRLWAVGARAVEELSGGEGRLELRTALGNDDEVSRGLLGDLPDGWVLRFVEVDERPAQTWRQFSEPIEVNGRLTIRPAWHPVSGRLGVLEVAIEPGGSFGLGDHPTTRLSAAAVDTLVRPGDAVADIGCGSGVLAIIAALRGAEPVVATDIAVPALEATIGNADRNGVADVVGASTTAVRDLPGEFDLVIANILAPTLVELAGDLRRLTKPSGRLVISGVLTDGYDHVVEALAPMRVSDVHDLDGWSALTLAHR